MTVIYDASFSSGILHLYLHSALISVWNISLDPYSGTKAPTDLSKLKRLNGLAMQENSVVP